MADRTKPPEIWLKDVSLDVWDRKSQKDVTDQVDEALREMLGKAGKLVKSKPKAGFIVIASGSAEHDEDRGEVAVEVKLVVTRADGNLLGKYSARGKLQLKDPARLEATLKKVIAAVAGRLDKDLSPDLAA